MAAGWSISLLIHNLREQFQATDIKRKYSISSKTISPDENNARSKLSARMYVYRSL